MRHYHLACSHSQRQRNDSAWCSLTLKTSHNSVYIRPQQRKQPGWILANVNLPPTHLLWWRRSRFPASSAREKARCSNRWFFLDYTNLLFFDIFEPRTCMLSLLRSHHHHWAALSPVHTFSTRRNRDWFILWRLPPTMSRWRVSGASAAVFGEFNLVELQRLAVEVHCTWW